MAILEMLIFRSPLEACQKVGSYNSFHFDGPWIKSRRRYLGSLGRPASAGRGFGIGDGGPEYHSRDPELYLPTSTSVRRGTRLFCLIHTHNINQKHHSFYLAVAVQLLPRPFFSPKSRLSLP